MLRKPTLEIIMKRYHMYLGELSSKSKVPSTLVNDMCNMKPVPSSDAQKIIDGVNHICNTTYTLEMISVELK